MPRTPKTVTLTVRLPVDLKKDVEKAASADDRSVTSFLIRALRERLAKGKDAR